MALQKAWYGNKKWVWLYLPFMFVFFCLSKLRKLGYKSGVFVSSKPKAFVIVVGNISVGGNGKTPTVIAICEHLTNKGLRCGVLSRGYGGSQAHFPHLLQDLDSPSLVGDEPMLMQNRLHCPIVIDPKRVRGANFLFEEHDCEVIICDDGLQHYALQRDFEIVVMDARGVGNGFLMPMGPLRESVSRLNTVDAVVFNGQPRTDISLSPDKTAMMTLEPNQWINVKSGECQSSLMIQKATAIAGIGDPSRFFATLSNMGITCDKTIGFPDHYAYKLADIPEGMVLMTEKDAVKCKSLAHENCWYLQVSGNISQNLYSLLDNKLKMQQR
jgi:tetraacyldisaccharide 4'-kinase